MAKNLNLKSISILSLNCYSLTQNSTCVDYVNKYDLGILQEKLLEDKLSFLDFRNKKYIKVGFPAQYSDRRINYIRQKKGRSPASPFRTKEFAM